MDIKFVWSVQTSTVPRDLLESKIREDIEQSVVSPCHPGTITAQLVSTDPIEVSINGKWICQCGKVLGSFSGASDGSKLTYNSY